MASNSRCESSNPNRDGMAKAVGLVVLNWASAEQNLDMVVAWLWHELGGKKPGKKIPFFLKEKLKFIRASINSDASLRSLSAEAGPVLDDVARLSELRNDLVHGAPAFIGEQEGHYVFCKFDLADGFHEVREVRMNVERYPEVTRELVALTRKTLELVKGVRDIALKRRSNQFGAKGCP